MNDNSDQQYQQQQLEQLKLETSLVSGPTTNDKLWTDQGINENIVQKIRSCIENGRLTSVDIDNRVCEQLRSFPSDVASIDSLFDEFNNSDLTGVVNKSAYLSNLIKQWKLRHPQEQSTSNNNSQTGQGSGDSRNDPEKYKPGPNEGKLKQILDRTGYKMEITVGQRKYGGPPPDGPDRSATNSEVFIGKLPREVFEDELIPICEEAGKIWDLRLMIDPVSGFNKGYCFVTFCSQPDSIKACERLNGYAIRPGKLIKANISVANLRLFIGNIPKTKSKEEIYDEVSKAVEGVTNVIVYTPADEADKKKNRGFCFVDFDTHKNASSAKRKLANARVRIFNRDIAVDWADPDEEPDNETMSKVKVLYVRNLTSDVSESDVNDLFLPYGNIERVRKVRDYAFVHFEKREDALNAMRVLHGKVLGRNSMEISLAKPLSDKRKQAQVKREQRRQFEPGFHSSGDFGYSTQGTGPLPGGFGRNLQFGPDNDGTIFPPNDPFNVNNFGAFAGSGPMNAGPSTGGMPNQDNRGTGSNRGRGSQDGNRGGFQGNRRGGINSGNRGGSGNFNQNNFGSFNNNARGGFDGPPQNNYSGGFNNGPNNQTGFGAFNGPPQNNVNAQYGRMGSGFGNNSMQPNQQYGGMKRSSNQMSDSGMYKRSRPDTGSWGSMGGNGSNNMNKVRPQQQQQQQQQQQHARGNWYQDQGYTSQQQSSYSWN